jgi:hypothetical protein
VASPLLKRTPVNAPVRQLPFEANDTKPLVGQSNGAVCGSSDKFAHRLCKADPLVMNENAKLLLELDGLVLLRKELEMPKPYVEESGFEYLDGKIDRLRRQLPGEILATYDRLSRKFSDPVTLVVDGMCQGCKHEVSARPAARLTKVPQCEHCGRFILTRQNAPGYV